MITVILIDTSYLSSSVVILLMPERYRTKNYDNNILFIKNIKMQVSHVKIFNKIHFEN